MQKVKRNISLDFQRRNNVRMVYATQCDLNYRVIVISLFNDGNVYAIQKSSGVVAAINVLRPDGKSSSFPATITGVGEVTYELTSWPLGIAGEVKLSLALYSPNGGRLATAPFTLHVAEGLYLGSQVEEDTENQTAFANMMAKLAELNQADQVREANETKRKENETERQRNESSRTHREEDRESGERYRENEEAGRYKNELDRCKNENTRIANENLRCQVTDMMIEGLDNLLAIQATYLSGAGGGV